MSSNEPDYLTSLVSYVPDINFGVNFAAGIPVNQFDASVAYQTQQFRPHSPELETVSAQAYCSQKHVLQPQNPPLPLRSALKKASVKEPAKFEDKIEETERVCKQLERAASTSGRTAKAKQDFDKLKPLPARFSQKKKTVAFGRTVNVSQTIEGTSGTPRFLNNKSCKMAEGEQRTLKAQFEKLDEKVQEMVKKIEELRAKDLERGDQFLKLTEMMKRLLEDKADCEVLRDSGGQDEKNQRCSARSDKRYRGKENIPPNEICMEDLHSETEEGSPGTAYQEMLAKLDKMQRKKSATRSSRDDAKWAIVKRKYMENKEFKRMVDEAIMKYGGDESLDVVASIECKGDTNRTRSHHREKKVRHLSPSPVVRSTTRVTKQMTVEQIRHCEDSPRSAAFSYDSKKYLARHGIIPALSEDDENTYKTANVRRSDPPLQSDYQPGNSVTYYSRRDKSNNSSEKQWQDLTKNRSTDHCFGEEKHYHGDRRPPRAVLGDSNYQLDHFDTDEDENVNDMIEISDDSEGNEQHGARGIKMLSPRGARAWRDSPRGNYRYQRNDDGRHYARQKLNKSAWN